MLDLQVARHVAQVKLLERAVHNTGPWAVRIGDSVALALRVKTQNRVLFVAHFEPGVEGEVAWLLCDGEEVTSRDIEADPAGFTVKWSIGYDAAEELARA